MNRSIRFGKKILIKIRRRSTISKDGKEITTHNKSANKNRSSLIRRKIKIENQQVFSLIRLIKPSTKEFLLKTAVLKTQFRRAKSFPLKFNVKNPSKPKKL